jgi:hypothetical protein
MQAPDRSTASKVLKPEEATHTSMIEDVSEDDDVQDMFRKVWPAVTDPNPLILFGFRRFRTSHLLNLRALEHDIMLLDHDIFQAGLQFGKETRKGERLALSHAGRDVVPEGASLPVVDRKKIEDLRSLLQQYGMFSCPIILVSDVPLSSHIVCLRRSTRRIQPRNDHGNIRACGPSGIGRTEQSHKGRDLSNSADSSRSSCPKQRQRSHPALAAQSFPTLLVPHTCS